MCLITNLIQYISNGTQLFIVYWMNFVPEQMGKTCGLLIAIWFVVCIAFLPSGRAQNLSSRVEQLCVVRTSSTFHSEISVSCLWFSHQCSKSAMQHAGRRSFYLFIYLFILLFFGLAFFPFLFLL